MCRNSIVTILRLALCWPLVVGTAVAADISVTSTFVPAGPQPAVPTCDAAAGAGQGGFETPDGQTRNWYVADDYCTSQGMRLPTKDELVALYDAYPNDQIRTTCGWPTDHTYWSATKNSGGGHHTVSLSNGFVGHDLETDYDYMACVR